VTVQNSLPKATDQAFDIVGGRRVSSCLEGRKAVFNYVEGGDSRRVPDECIRNTA
jgi:hypothetical protein